MFVSPPSSRQGAVPKGNATKKFMESLQLKPGEVIYKCPKCCSIKPERAHHCRSGEFLKSAVLKANQLLRKIIFKCPVFHFPNQLCLSAVWCWVCSVQLVCLSSFVKNSSDVKRRWQLFFFVVISGCYSFKF